MPTRPTPQRKAVLFCPDCGRMDAIDGEWITHVAPAQYRYACPACEATVITQPRF